MIEFATTPMYSLVEVLGAILLAALPMSRIAEIMLGVFERKTGIKLTVDENN